jgi:hypothetical protein
MATTRPPHTFAMAVIATMGSFVMGCTKRAPTADEASSRDASLATPSTSSEGDAPSLATPQSTGHTSTAGEMPVASIVVLDPGRPPRRKLRYVWNAARDEQLAMDLQTTASSTTSASAEPTGASAAPSQVPLPSVRVVLAIHPQTVSSDGELRYAWRTTSATVRVDARTPPAISDGMRAEVAQIEHLSGTAVVTARGLVREVTVEPGTPADSGGTGQMIDQIRQTLRDLSAPLPEEDVGVSARWQKTSELDASSAHISQTDTFTLAALQRATGTLDDALSQTASPQSLRVPGSGQATPAHMDSLVASGNAHVRFDLSRVVPQTTFAGTTAMVVSAAPGDGPRMAMTVHVAITIRGTTR